jgi:ElaB/YqjD/DUF883 family membrane-anchored ribosome-binding protein
MTYSPKPGDERRSLPDDIALAAGMPRGHYDDAPRHTQAGSTADDVRAGAESLRDKALGAADDLTNRAAGAARDLRERASDAYDDARGWASDARADGRRRIHDLGERGTERFRDGRSAVEAFVTDNPLLVGVVGLAAGLLIGALLPRTRQEDETVGPWADEVRDQGLRYARDVTHRGREFVASALDPENLQAAAQRATGTEPSSAPGERATAQTH